MTFGPRTKRRPPSSTLSFDRFELVVIDAGKQAANGADIWDSTEY